MRMSASWPVRRLRRFDILPVACPQLDSKALLSLKTENAELREIALQVVHVVNTDLPLCIL